MKRVSNIDKLLQDWPYEPNSVSVRMAKGADGRNVIQMRIEMGVLQLETEGRPDGTQPFGQDTVYEHLTYLAMEDEGLVMDEDQCFEVDREFVQFYHRRICWLALRKFDCAVRDATHTLGLMDFCKEHSPDESWTMAHEQYRPFVLFHRVQASALGALEDSEPERAVEIINAGLKAIQDVNLMMEYDEDLEEDNELIDRLIELRESLREKFSVGKTLQEKLNEAIATEQYELAAQIRDELASRSTKA